MKLIIAGSRNIDKHKVMHWLDRNGVDDKDLEIVCGMAKGPDLAGKEWASTLPVPVIEFPADWTKYGKTAGFIRNCEMAKYGDELIAFWDGKSHGTKHMIQCMMDECKPFQVILIKDNNEI